MTKPRISNAASAALLGARWRVARPSAPLESALDAKGRTEVRATAVITLARPAPRFSETARDYLYLAPVEVNETGHAPPLHLARACDDRRSRLAVGGAERVRNARARVRRLARRVAVVVVGRGAAERSRRRRRPTTCCARR